MEPARSFYVRERELHRLTISHLNVSLLPLDAEVETLARLEREAAGKQEQARDDALYYYSPRCRSYLSWFGLLVAYAASVSLLLFLVTIVCVVSEYHSGFSQDFIYAHYKPFLFSFGTCSIIGGVLAGTCALWYFWRV